MSFAKDLLIFRKEWEKELKEKNKEKANDISHVSSKLVLKNEAEIKPSVTVDVGTSSGIIYDGNEFILKRPSVTIDDDDNSADGCSSDLSKAPLYNYNEGSDSCEYYPFRILTQFLNEAPKKAKTTMKSAKNQQGSHGETYCKRKYFQSANSESKQPPNKAPKNDPSLTNSFDVKAKVDTEGKRMLDIFLADLVCTRLLKKIYFITSHMFH